MFHIRPIQSKEEQKELCRLCNVEYDEDCLAYGAYIEERFSGICQFRLGEHGYIQDLCPRQDVEDFEVMFIMGRTTMNFIDLCGIHTCFARRMAGDQRLIRAIGFHEIEGQDDLFADMTGMFDGSHCTGGHAGKQE